MRNRTTPRRRLLVGLGGIVVGVLLVALFDSPYGSGGGFGLIGVSVVNIGVALYDLREERR
ncbi:hypothetical protein [Kribbella sp. NPDC051770]|uniref:hypothetical protein n=1 Tax=Kribbella sp. NPDC051770 TaxID=3155413 RepID=UPI00341336C5